MNYHGRIAVVTGAGSGIGRALTQALTRGRGACRGRRHRRKGPQRDASSVPTRPGHAVPGRRGGPGRGAGLRRRRAPATRARLDVVQQRRSRPVRERGGHVVERFRLAHRHQHRWGRQRHQGLPAATRRGRFRPAPVAVGEPVQCLRVDRGALPRRLQHREVRGARFHRGAAPRDDHRTSPGDRPLRAPGVVKTNFGANMRAAETEDPDQAAKLFARAAITSPRRPPASFCVGPRRTGRGSSSALTGA